MIILDGGLGQELVKRAGKATDLWSMQALLDTPDMVRAVHDEYFAVGAQVATTNTYSVLPDRLESKGLADKLRPMTVLACELAVAARDAHGSGRVAGSMGPIGFSYQPDKAPPAEQAAEIYADIARLHADYVDFHILETMASVDQARGGLMGAGVTGKPIYVSLSVDDSDGTKLRSGEPLTDAIEMLKAFNPAAVLINCSLPEAVSKGLPALGRSRVYSGRLCQWVHGYSPGIQFDPCDGGSAEISNRFRPGGVSRLCARLGQKRGGNYWWLLRGGSGAYCASRTGTGRLRRC